MPESRTNLRQDVADHRPMTELTDSPGSAVRPAGAKSGAVLCGLVWTAVDAGGSESSCSRSVWTVVDAYGHGL